MKQHVVLNVNGEEYDIEPNRLLLQTLREDIGLTGTKEGCSIGVCSVIGDGRLGVDPTTLARWEYGRSKPTKRSFEIVNTFVDGLAGLDLLNRRV